MKITKPNGMQHLQRIMRSNEAQAQADALFLSIGEGAIATDELGRISRVNHVALAMLGCKEKDLIGKPFLKAIEATDTDGNTIDPLDRAITQAFVTGKTISAKSNYYKNTGESFAVSLIVSPILLKGEPIGAIEVFRDITQEEEIDRMKSEFISIASHQLRTPLTAIKTYAHLLQSGYAGKLSRPQLQFLKIVLGSAEHMNKLIDMLLDISKIETGRLTVIPAMISPQKLVKEVCSEFTSQLKQNKIKLQTALIGLPKEIYVDPLLTKEIYSNLLSNAVKYTGEGGKINLSLTLKKNNLLFKVADTGCGIPDNQKDRIFGKFFRAGNVLTLDSNGSGLGLYLVKKIAQSMGGDVWFESQEDVGSTFFFTVPCDMNAPKLPI